MIILLYMPPHSSHHLQPLDMTCFSLLKHFYSKQTAKIMENRIFLIKKEDFLYIFPSVFKCSISLSNIQSSFAATSLILLLPEKVLSRLPKPKTPTPPSTSESNQLFGVGKTPANLCQLEKQKRRIQNLQSRQLISPSTMEQAVDKIVKSAEITMQNAVLVQQEIQQLRAGIKY
jgi:hypothetical protein